jgi:hypothetical protein
MCSKLNVPPTCRYPSSQRLAELEGEEILLLGDVCQLIGATAGEGSGPRTGRNRVSRNEGAALSVNEGKQRRYLERAKDFLE